jgi:hypothetical protein
MWDASRVSIAPANHRQHEGQVGESPYLAFAASMLTFFVLTTGTSKFRCQSKKDGARIILDERDEIHSPSCWRMLSLLAARGIAANGPGAASTALPCKSLENPGHSCRL